MRTCQQLFALALVATCLFDRSYAAEAEVGADGSVSSGAAPQIMEWSDETAEYIKANPVRTLFMLKAESELDEYTPIIDGLLDTGKKFPDCMYVVIPASAEEARKQYFEGITYTPAVFAVNRTTGAYARPTNEFTAAEKGDYTATFTDFMQGFLEHVQHGTKDVLELTSDTFQETMDKYPTVLVAFYAPWCGHCKKLVPQFQKAAESLKELVPPVPCANVDATTHTDLKLKFKVDAFPSIQAFRNGARVDTYDGELKAGALVAYVKRMLKPTKVLASVDEVDSFLAANKQAIVRFSASEEGAKAFGDAAAASEHAFASCPDAAAAAAHGATAAQPVVVFGAATGEASIALEPTAIASGVDLNVAVEEAMWPLVMQFQRSKTQQKRVQMHPVKNMLILVLDKEDLGFDEALDQLRVAAQANSKSVLHLWADSRDQMMMGRLRVSKEELPAAVLFNPFKGGTKTGKRLTAPELEEVTSEALLALEAEFLAGLAELEAEDKKKREPKDWAQQPDKGEKLDPGIKVN